MIRKLTYEKRIFLCLFGLLAAGTVSAQRLDFTVQGLITGDQEPLIGVTIFVEELGIGTVSDINGRYELEGAALPAYDGPEDQEAIYTNRAIELFFSGFRLEDSRRFGRPGPFAETPERNRNFYPYPNSERDNNPNTPANPDV